MEINTISKEELFQKLSEGENIQLVNVLEPEYYTQGSIKGSKRIPLSELENSAGDLDQSQDVIVYCAGYGCDASEKAAIKLEQMGFNVRAYRGGISEWEQSGLPMEHESKAA